MALSYRLAVLTHGDASTLQETLASFYENVSPKPTDAMIYYDGFLTDFKPTQSPSVRVYGCDGPEGFCVATRKLWSLASMGPGPQFVFWLEHDFEFVKRVDLRDLAAVLVENPGLAQVALMRDAVNEREKAAGGLYESRPGEYEPRVEIVSRESAMDVAWLEQTSYFTTNPSLMLRGFMLANPWPDYSEFCEGVFGADLRERGYSYGVMGRGEPWVRHVGVRDGFGY